MLLLMFKVLLLPPPVRSRMQPTVRTDAGPTCSGAVAALGCMLGMLPHLYPVSVPVRAPLCVP